MIVITHPLSLRKDAPLFARSPLAEDAGAMLSFLRTLYRESYRNMNSTVTRFAAMKDEEEAKILGDHALAPDKFMIAAFESGRIVGNIGIFGQGGDYTRHSARLGMGILRSHQNLGLGRALIRLALDSCAQAGLSRLELTVRTFNAPAIRLYESSGFERVGLLKNAARIDGEFHDEFLYQLGLPAPQTSGCEMPAPGSS